MTKRQKIIIVVGPTASGKSALAVKLAKKFNGEIISADSRQVYKGLDIGTGKITRREMEGVPHHLLDAISPKKVFTAQRFLLRGRNAIDEIAKRGKLPIVCGGTGFYIDALVGHIRLAEVPRDSVSRARLEKKSTVELFALLRKRDRKRAASIDRHNRRRLIRALEIHSAHKSKESRVSPPRYEMLWIGLQPKKDMLRDRINTRLVTRLRLGMIAEAKRLHNRGLSYKRMNDLGLEYRWLAQFLQKKVSHSEMEARLQSAIWQFAKRQMTYWRRNTEIRWFSPDATHVIETTVEKWLTDV